MKLKLDWKLDVYGIQTHCGLITSKERQTNRHSRDRLRQAKKKKSTDVCRGGRMSNREIGLQRECVMS